HSVSAAYSGDTTFAGSTGTDTQTVEKAATKTVVSSSPQVSSPGETVSFTAAVAPAMSGAGTPTGTVSFVVSDGVTTVNLSGTLNDGQATVTTNGLVTEGKYGVKVEYSGDGAFLASNVSSSQQVAKKATATTLLSSPDPSSFGQTATLTATVSPLAPTPGVPSGTVMFAIDGESTLMGVLSEGVATVTTTALGVGSHSVSAAYSGDTTFAGSTGTDTQTVEKAATKTVVSSPSTTPGQPVTITATVSAVPPGAGTPMGTVSFVVSNGVTTVNLSGTLNDGKTTVTTDELVAVGVYDITAAYGGDNMYAASSGTDSHTVAKAPTKVAVPEVRSTVFGQLITFKTIVTPVGSASGTPTGTVTFSIDGVGGGIMTGTLASGVAEVSTTTLAPGTHLITAAYNGDASFLISKGLGKVAIRKASTSTTVTLSPSPSVVGQPVTFTAAVAVISPGAGTPTGFVNFNIAGGGTLSGVVVDGTATATTSSLGVGAHSVSAMYLGDTNFVTSTGTVDHNVNQASTTTTVSSSPNPSQPGDTVTFMAVVEPVDPGSGVPDGTVDFAITGGSTTVNLSGSLDSSGVATVDTELSGTGEYTVTGSYPGSARFAGSSGSVTQTVAGVVSETVE
ncbi:beta strand repeat-containing protein, partial [Streptomyces sp. NPDC092307]|uniref:beta strand repeat-containing protein n=1 Tax=Streptomyces sp. NPDC092307 TaxID=3366013 RepID=UPI00380C8D0E